MVHLWTISGPGGTVGADPMGIRITAPDGGGLILYKQIQRIHEVTPVDGQLTFVAARLAVPVVGDSRLWFGVWTGQPDPFGTIPDYVAVFEKLPSSSALYGLAKYGQSGVATTGALLTLQADAFVDLAVVINGENRIDFICARGDGTWASSLLTMPLPDKFATPLRVGFIYQRGSASGSLVVRSLHVQEVILQE